MVRQAAFWLDRIARWLCAAILATMCGVILLQVFCRYVLRNALVWPEELAIFLLVWLAFVGGAVAVGQRSHVALDWFVSHLRGPVAGAVGVLGDLIVAGLSFLLAVKGGQIAWMVRREVSDALGISLAWPRLGLVVGSLLMGIQALANALDRARGMFPAGGNACAQNRGAAS